MHLYPDSHFLKIAHNSSLLFIFCSVPGQSEMPYTSVLQTAMTAFSVTKYFHRSEQKQTFEQSHVTNDVIALCLIRKEVYWVIFSKNNSLVGVMDRVVSQSVSQWSMFVCHTNQVWGTVRTNEIAVYKGEVGWASFADCSRNCIKHLHKADLKNVLIVMLILCLQRVIKMARNLLQSVLWPLVLRVCDKETSQI